MPRSLYEFQDPDRFIVGTVGMPGERQFFLQCVKDRRIVSVAIEKGQAKVLADGLDRILDELHRGGVDVPMSNPGDADLEPLTTPIESEFQAVAMGLAWNEMDHVLVLEVHGEAEDGIEIPDVEEDVEEGPDCLRVRFSLEQAREFVYRTNKVVAAGRKVCQFCQLMMEPHGHICPRSNGFRRSAS